jgi:hypothetical protein
VHGGCASPALLDKRTYREQPQVGSSSLVHRALEKKCVQPDIEEGKTRQQQTIQIRRYFKQAKVSR